jgi:hypothetical protein
MLLESVRRYIIYMRAHLGQQPMNVPIASTVVVAVVYKLGHWKGPHDVKSGVCVCVHHDEISSGRHMYEASIIAPNHTLNATSVRAGGGIS